MYFNQNIKKTIFLLFVTLPLIKILSEAKAHSGKYAPSKDSWVHSIHC